MSYPLNHAPRAPQRKGINRRVCTLHCGTFMKLRSCCLMASVPLIASLLGCNDDRLCMTECARPPEGCHVEGLSCESNSCGTWVCPDAGAPDVPVDVTRDTPVSLDVTADASDVSDATDVTDATDASDAADVPRDGRAYDAGSYACGTLTCGSHQVCLHPCSGFDSGMGGPPPVCIDVPAACDGTPTCDCVRPSLCPTPTPMPAEHPACSQTGPRDLRCDLCV